jgi:hypothetical protein
LPPSSSLMGEGRHEIGLVGVIVYTDPGPVQELSTVAPLIC